MGSYIPASLLVREELKSVDNRPARQAQFHSQMRQVHDIETAKAPVEAQRSGRTRCFAGCPCRRRLTGHT
jgi:hypothetical protein